MRIWLSGFATRAEYEALDPSWDGDEEYPDRAAADAAARAWLKEQGPEAQVEVQRISAKDGNDVAEAVAVITQSGVEEIN